MAAHCGPRCRAGPGRDDGEVRRDAVRVGVGDPAGHHAVAADLVDGLLRRAHARRRRGLSNRSQVDRRLEGLDDHAEAEQRVAQIRARARTCRATAPLASALRRSSTIPPAVAAELERRVEVRVDGAPRRLERQHEHRDGPVARAVERGLDRVEQPASRRVESGLRERAHGCAPRRRRSENVTAQPARCSGARLQPHPCLGDRRPACPLSPSSRRSGLGPAPDAGSRRRRPAPGRRDARSTDSTRSSMCVSRVAKWPPARVAIHPPSVEYSNDCGIEAQRQVVLLELLLEPRARSRRPGCTRRGRSPSTSSRRSMRAQLQGQDRADRRRAGSRRRRRWCLRRTGCTRAPASAHQSSTAATSDGDRGVATASGGVPKSPRRARDEVGERAAGRMQQAHGRRVGHVRRQAVR